MKKVILKSGREKSILRHHPWIFSGAIDHADAQIQPGETIGVVSQDGERLALAAYSPHSQIRARIWTFNPDEKINKDFFRERLEQAMTMRRRCLEGNPSALRLVNAESDRLPGLIVDRYADYLVCQFLSAGVEYFKQEILEQLRSLLEPVGIFERSDTESRQKEGLSASTGLLYGSEPPELITIAQDGIKILVDVRQGHKTGMYLDQRENRNIVRQYASRATVLNCFAYTGAFSLVALSGDATQVTNIESSAHALNMLLKNTELNGFPADSMINVQGDAFQLLREFRDRDAGFDLVILDPPKFVHSAQQLQRGCRGYKDINLLAMKLLNENGVLITFSCSGHLPPDLFQKIVADAALDAGRNARIVKVLGQPADHPVALNFPEGSYLKGLVCYLD
jgi:23S rRNA (cytosine1962-C5)-methyltransferase